MKIEICKWRHDSLSPVMFMIDDFCNVWVDSKGNGIIDLGEDWGYARRGQGSSLVYLEENLLDKYPDLRVTFFIPVGIRAGVINNPKTKMISKMINCDQETKEFFRSVGDDPRYEAAYHGTTHGVPGETAAEFVQEWISYKDLGEALSVIKWGKEVFRDTFGHYPAGGKYPGYEYNEFSDESIDRSGFSWWCRSGDMGGNDPDPLSNFDIRYFGESRVVDIPSTVNGAILNRILDPGPLTVKGVIKRLFKDSLIELRLKEIRYLIDNRLVISIQEHIAPSRVDDRRQEPNIFDDRESLKTIFEFLKGFKLWYCTGTELERYVRARDTSRIEVSGEHDTFRVLCGNPGSNGGKLTIKISDSSKKRIIQPDGAEKLVQNGLAEISILPGTYSLY